MNKLVFDIGATNTKFALMSADGRILAREKAPTDYSSVEGFLNSVLQLAAKYRAEGDAIAVSTNGRMAMDGDTYRAYTMKLLQGVNLRRELEDRTGLPVAVLNDGFSAALGEWWKGAGRGANNLLTVVLGSGMGSGLILNGKLYQGSKRNAAMMFGMIHALGESAELSGMSTTFSLLLYGLAGLKQIPMTEMTGQKFFELIEDKDAAALSMVDRYCESIATLIFNAALLLDLDRVVVTGGLSDRDILIDSINRKLQQLPQRAMQDESVRVLLEMAAVDVKDFEVQVIKGELALDANVYGALYHLLYPRK